MARFRSDQPLTDTDIAALDRLDHGPDGPEIDPDDVDPDCAPPEWWLAMSGEQKAWLDDPEPVPAQPDVLDAGFIHHGGSGGIGFAAGGLLDGMDACEALTVCAGRVWDQGLGTLSDGELAGLIGAARRITSRQAALELAAVGELAARRAVPGCRRRAVRCDDDHTIPHHKGGKTENATCTRCVVGTTAPSRPRAGSSRSQNREC